MKINELESSTHLYQPPLYRAADRSWHRSYNDAVACSGDCLTWDVAAILSILSFGYPCGDRTLVNEIKRQPWLSEIGPNGEPRPEDIPDHHTLWKPYEEIAENLGCLLYEEALQVCQGRQEIYLLTSGGLDSRIVAGIVAKLVRDKKLAVKPVVLTWGLPDSRDVAYGRAVARILGFEWAHTDIGPEDIIKNIEESATTLGGLVSPLHLHSMLWFKGVSKEALVLAGSYGDMVGRAEFSYRHLLEINYLRPRNRFTLINPKVLGLANDRLQTDLKDLHRRSPGAPKYVLCEHEMGGHYMRGLIAHTMSAINNYCTIYQMFTHLRVYSYMWSIHPALRFDNIYAELLKQLDPRLARLPWARTNRALRGQTKGAHTGLRPAFHEYEAWISGPLHDELCRYVEPEWFAETEIFNAESIRALCRGDLHIKESVLLVWLAGFRRFAERLNELGKHVKLDPSVKGSSTETSCLVEEGNTRRVPQVLRQSHVLHALHALVKRTRRFFLKRQALLKYPKNAL